jgi:adenylate cyclase
MGQPTSIDVIASAVEDASVPRLSQQSSPDGAVTLMFCEIANIVTIRTGLSAEQIATLLEDQRRVVHNIANRFAGRVTAEHDDGFLISFDSAHAALHCAVEVQTVVASAPTGEQVPVELRMGLHTGFVIGEHERLYGRNVLLGARIAGEAGGGEIVVSAKVREYTRADPGLRFTSRGEHHFKGLHGEHELFVVNWSEPAAAVSAAD